MILDEINKLDDVTFMKAFGGIAEHTPWVAERARAARPYASRDAMIRAFQKAVREASLDEQRALIAAHPDLATRAALAPFSQTEQAGAGLDTLSPDELVRFTDLNMRYRERFGFPFIFAVKGATKHQILDAFEERLQFGHAEEFLTALDQVTRIIRFRLEDAIDG